MKTIPNLTNEQIGFIRDVDRDIRRTASINFYLRKRQTKNVLLRLTVVAIPAVFLLLLAFLPINYFITGRWGYEYGKVKWYSSWLHACNLM